MHEYIDPSSMTFGQGARVLLMGGIFTLLLRVIWGRRRSPDDRVLAIALIWGSCVFVLIGARVALASAAASSPALPLLVRLQDTFAIAPIPMLLLALSKGARASDRPTTTALVVATSLAVVWVWLDGPVRGGQVVTRTFATGASYSTLATGALMPLFGLIAGAAWIWAIRLALRQEGEGASDLRAIVIVGGGLLAGAGANDSLMDAGVIESVPLIDVACLVALLLFGRTLSRRARASLGGARTRVERQTRELEQHHVALALRERQIALGALAAGLGHEINNPLTVVAVSLDRAVELLRELDRLAMVRSSLVECRDACHGVAQAVLDFGAVRRKKSEDPSRDLAEPSEGRLRILVVDDEPLVAKSLRRVLRAHDVSIAYSGAEALAMLRDGQFDRVLCDVMMPGMNGPEVYRTLEEEGRLAHLGFVFVTGGAFSSDVAEAVQSTGARVLRKPVDPAELDRLVTRAPGAQKSEPRNEAVS